MSNPQVRSPEQVSSHSPLLPEFENGAVVNIDKPAGWTSFDVVKKIRNTIRVKKVGHAGTLDPFATGVLIVCTGKATKRVSQLMTQEKEYAAKIELGKTTDTYDCTGTFLTEADPTAITDDEVRNACRKFQGKISQKPPMYSAVQVNGVRLYQLARKGIEIERESREVFVHRLEILSVDLPFVELRITCSKGTYIRSLAHDLGQELGCGAYLQSLTRTRVGDFLLDDATTISDFVNSIRRSMN